MRLRDLQGEPSWQCQFLQGDDRGSSANLASGSAGWEFTGGSPRACRLKLRNSQVFSGIGGEKSLQCCAALGRQRIRLKRQQPRKGNRIKDIAVTAFSGIAARRSHRCLDTSGNLLASTVFLTGGIPLGCVRRSCEPSRSRRLSEVKLP